MRIGALRLKRPSWRTQPFAADSLRFGDSVSRVAIKTVPQGSKKVNSQPRHLSYLFNVVFYIVLGKGRCAPQK